MGDDTADDVDEDDPSEERDSQLARAQRLKSEAEDDDRDEDEDDRDEDDDDRDEDDDDQDDRDQDEDEYGDPDQDEDPDRESFVDPERKEMDWRIDNDEVRGDYEDFPEDFVEEAPTGESKSDERMTLALPRIDLNAQGDPLLAGEWQRQVAEQMAGLNHMTVEDWLFRSIFNRMKSTTSQSSSSSGTDTGRFLAGLLDRELYRNDALARDLMGRVVARADALLRKMPGSGVAKQLKALANAATSQKSEVYRFFHGNQGVTLLEVLHDARLKEGIGRAHGDGDEVWFREKYADGIALLAGTDMYGNNNVLHNPDQCAGGPMEILTPAEQTALSQAQKDYQSARTQYRLITGRLDSYRQTPPSDLTLVTAAELELSQVEARLGRAAEAYMRLMWPHVGNGPVNQALGEMWMTPVGKGGPSRIEILLAHALQAHGKGQGRQRLNVTMEVRPDIEPLSPALEMPPFGRMPDSGARLKVVKRKESSTTKAKKAEKRVEAKKKTKMEAPQQRSIADMFSRAPQGVDRSAHVPSQNLPSRIHSVGASSQHVTSSRSKPAGRGGKSSARGGSKRGGRRKKK